MGLNMNNDWRDGFLFLGNNLLLDFVNTRPIMDGQPMEMLTDGAARLPRTDAFAAVQARFGPGPPSCAIPANSP